MPSNNPPLPASASKSASKKPIRFPDGEVIVISDDEDEIQVIRRPQHLASPALPLRQGAHIDPIPSSLPRLPQNLSSHTASSSNLAPRRRVKKRFQFGDGEIIEFSSDEEDTTSTRGPTLPPLKNEPMDVDPHRQIHLPSFNLPPFMNGASSSRQPSDTGSNGAKRKRYVFDDTVIDLTDDEDEASPSGSVGSSESSFFKRPKLEPTAYGNSLLQPPIGPLATTLAHTRLASNMPPMNFEPQIPGGWPGNVPNPLGLGVNYPGASFLSMAGPSNAPPQNTTGLHFSNGFNINYDDQGPIRAIDVGGPDHAEK